MTEITSISRTSSIIKLIQDTLSVVLGFVGITTGLGFVVVTAHLSRYGTVQGYAIAPGQYIAAGILVTIPALLVYVISQSLLEITINKNSHPRREIDLPKHTQLLHVLERLTDNPELHRLDKFSLAMEQLYPALLEYPTWTFDLADIFRETSESDYAKIAESLRTKIQHLEYEKTKSKYLQAFRFSLLILGIFVMVFVFVSLFYEAIPFAIGGGKPEPIVLIFEDSDIASVLQIESAHTPKQSRIVWLLAELVDGVLILDKDSNRVLSIKDKLIIARLSS